MFEMKNEEEEDKKRRKKRGEEDDDRLCHEAEEDKKRRKKRVKRMTTDLLCLLLARFIQSCVLRDVQQGRHPPSDERRFIFCGDVCVPRV